MNRRLLEISTPFKALLVESRSEYSFHTSVMEVSRSGIRFYTLVKELSHSGIRFYMLVKELSRSGKDSDRLA